MSIITVTIHIKADNAEDSVEIRSTAWSNGDITSEQAIDMATTTAGNQAKGAVQASRLAPTTRPPR